MIFGILNFEFFNFDDGGSGRWSLTREGFFNLNRKQQGLGAKVDPFIGKTRCSYFTRKVHRYSGFFSCSTSALALGHILSMQPAS